MESNPDLYQKMCERFETNAQAQAALTKFGDMVEAARVECRISDIELVMMCRGPSDALIWGFHIGDTHNAEPMAAWALGKAKKEREDLIASLVASGGAPLA